MLIYKDDNHPDRSFNLSVTDDEVYMILSSIESTSGNAFAIQKTGEKNGAFTWLDENFDTDYHVIGNVGSMLFVMTNYKAPRYKLVGIDVENPARENWIDILPEHQSNVLESVSLAGGRLIASYLQDAYNTATVFDLNGVLSHQVSLPGIGSLGGIGARMEDNIAFYSFFLF